MRFGGLAVLTAFAILTTGAPVAVSSGLAGAVMAAPSPAQQLGTALKLPEVIAVLADEGRIYGDTLASEYFAEDAGEDWRHTIEEIYAPKRLALVFEAAFEADLDRSEIDTASVLNFFLSPLGRRIVGLELSARRALLAKEVELAAHKRLETLRAEEAPRLMLLEDFIAANDLVEMNVVSALNSNVAFMRGLAGTGFFGDGLSQDEMLADVWGQEDALRQQSEDWLMMFATLAYAPLSDTELARYTAFSRSAAGVRLNHALFAGFDAVFAQVSDQLGHAVGVQGQGTSL